MSGASPNSGTEQAVLNQPGLVAGNEWPKALPADVLQPWEQLNSDGHAVPAGGSRGASALNQDSEFIPGVERFLEGGAAADNGEATHLSSTAGGLSYAMYRVPLGGAEPGVVSVDANLTAGNGYYVGLADYGRKAWDWHGPFADNHIRLSTAGIAGADFTSSLGSVFICIAAYDGAACDVVGVGVNQVDPGDSAEPPAPGAPSVTAVNGGLELEWLPVVAGDLAGYRVYYGNQWFLDRQGAGVKSEDSLEGLTRNVLGGLNAKSYVRISSVDISGNESGLSNIVSAEPLAAAPLPLHVAVSSPSGVLGDTIGFTATGAASYDFDTDGDGTYDITGDTSGMASIDTSALGIIRAMVRGSAGSGTSVALGGVSVIVAGNSRPVACASATPTSGDAPLNVTFTGSESTDFDGTVVGGGWDFDGDGNYDAWSDTDTAQISFAMHTYDTPGVYNAKLRVVDDNGAWDVDTVAVVVSAEASANNPPVANLQGEPTSGDAPLTVNFDASGSNAGGDPGDSLVKFEWDMDGDDAYEAYGEDPSHAYTYAAPGAFTAKVRVTDSAGNQDAATVTVSVNVPGNNPPTAALTAFPSSGQTPLDVDFDASGSSAGGDPGDSIVRYDWDFNGDGHYEAYDGGPQPATCTFTLPGTHYIAVRVTDSYGAQATQSIAVTAYSWISSTIDSQGSVGQYCSLRLVNGNPAIAYLDVTNLDLKYIRASNPEGTAWGAPVTVVASGDSGKYCSLAVINGNPAISYWFASNDTLRFVRANDTSGASWGASVVVDATSGTGRYSSLAMGNGAPIVAYYYFNSGDLRFATADDGVGSTWSQIFTVDATNNVGQHCRLAIVNGNPAISYYDATNGNLMYTRAVDAAGTNWGGAKLTVESANDVGLYGSLAIVSDRPAISYYDQTNNDLRYIRATDPNGGGWGVPLIVDSADVTGRDSSLAVIGGYPAISYYSFTNGDLMYVRATDFTGAAWGTPVAVDSFNTTGEYTSLLELNGQPAIGYFYTSGADLKFAIGSY